MKKQDLMRTIARKTGFSQKDISAVLEAYADTIVETLSNDKDEKVVLPNVGTFKVKNVAARDGVSAINGKAWHKDEHSEIVFKTLNALKNI